MASSESRFATKSARLTVIAAAVAAIVVAGLDAVERIIAVPSLPEGIIRERVTVTEFRRIEDVREQTQKPKVEEPLVEHTAEESDFEVEAKPEPPPEPIPEPEPEPIPEPVVEPPPPPPEPEPELIPEPEPEPEPEPPPPPAPEPPPPPPPPEPKPVPKPVPKPKPAKPAVKPAPKPVKPVAAAPAPAAEPAAEAPSDASAGASGSASGGGAGGASSAGGSSSAGDESAALASIVREVEAHKQYPRRARQTGVEGRVVLAVSISASGVVTAVEVAEKHSSALLNRAALKAADGLVGMKLPLSKAMTVKVPVVFSLSGS